MVMTLRKNSRDAPETGTTIRKPHPTRCQELALSRGTSVLLRASTGNVDRAPGAPRRQRAAVAAFGGTQAVLPRCDRGPDAGPEPPQRPGSLQLPGLPFAALTLGCARRERA